MTEEQSQAVVREVDGQLVLDDPVALGVITAVAKHNCRNTFDLNAERVLHFKNRVAERGLDPNTVVIVLLNVDDPNGAALADVLMPGYNWQEVRDRGEVPIARGLAMREGIQEALDHLDKDAAEKLRTWPSGTAVVVVDHGTADIFTEEGL